MDEKLEPKIEERKWGTTMEKYLDVAPEFGSAQYFAMFGRPSDSQYAAYAAHMCG